MVTLGLTALDPAALETEELSGKSLTESSGAPPILAGAEEDWDPALGTTSIFNLLFRDLLLSALAREFPSEPGRSPCLGFGSPSARGLLFSSTMMGAGVDVPEALLGKAREIAELTSSFEKF